MIVLWVTFRKIRYSFFISTLAKYPEIIILIHSLVYINYYYKKLDYNSQSHVTLKAIIFIIVHNKQMYNKVS